MEEWKNPRRISTPQNPYQLKVMLELRYLRYLPTEGTCRTTTKRIMLSLRLPALDQHSAFAKAPEAWISGLSFFQEYSAGRVLHCFTCAYYFILPRVCGVCGVVTRNAVISSSVNVQVVL